MSTNKGKSYYSFESYDSFLSYRLFPLFSLRFSIPGLDFYEIPPKMCGLIFFIHKIDSIGVKEIDSTGFSSFYIFLLELFR